MEPSTELLDEMVEVYFLSGEDGPEPRTGMRDVVKLLAGHYCLEDRGHAFSPSDKPPPQWPSGRGDQHPHYCVSCSDGTLAGRGCIHCRNTGMFQMPTPDCQECKR
jgi:hypothetical protein